MWKIKNGNTFAEAITQLSKMAPYSRDVDLRNGSRREGERNNTPTKQHQGKAGTTKAQQDWPVNMVINS
jgi:hypothetical protein